MDKRHCCGTCAFHLPVAHNEFVCDNENSDAYTTETEYDDCCTDWEDWEEK